MALNQLWCDYLIDCDLPQCETLILFICIATNVKELSCCCLARAGALPEITEIHVRQRARAHTNMLSDWEQKIDFYWNSKSSHGCTNPVHTALELFVDQLWWEFVTMTTLKRKTSLLLHFMMVGIRNCDVPQFTFVTALLSHATCPNMVNICSVAA